MQQDGWAFSIEGYETAGSVSRLWSQGTWDQDREYLIHALLRHRQTQKACGQRVISVLHAQSKQVLCTELIHSSFCAYMHNFDMHGSCFGIKNVKAEKCFSLS